MRTTWMILAALAVVGGVAVGVGLTMTRLDPAEMVAPVAVAQQAAAPAADPRFPPLPPADGPQPKLVVVGSHVYDFGEMEIGSHGTRTWTFRNEGDYPLELRQGESTCKCTIAGVETNNIPPGESAEITLKWTVKGRSPFFRQSATILTNDPLARQVELIAEGTITDTVRAVPDFFSANKPRKRPKTFEVKVFCMRTDDFQITGHRFSNKELAPYFHVETESLGDENLLRAWGARGAYNVRITVEPELPEGAIEQRVILATNLPQRPEVMITLALAAENAISLFGKGWHPDEGLLDLGDVRAAEGLERKLRIMVRGADAEKFQLRVADVYPEFVAIQAEAPRRQGNSMAVPLTLRVPPGAPVSSFLGGKTSELGEVRIETTHPDLSEWVFRLRFSVLP